MRSAESPEVRVILALRDGLQQTLDELNKILEELAPPGTGTPGDIPHIDLADLDAAGWTSYKTKNPAQPGEPAWIKNPVHFTSYEAPPVILELIKAMARVKPQRLQLGDMEYFFSGEGKFLSRRPAKKESAKGK